jgi:ParB family transcriptional regulator, chromosome partitioning protein
MVRPLKGSERYQLVAGERRWRAARMAGLDEVPVIIRELDDRQTMEIALIENLQRENLDPVEEANGYGALIDEYGLTQEEVARRVGKSRPAVTNALRLLSLPDEVLGLVRDGSLSAGHGRALLACSDAQVISAIAADVVKKGLSVRETERLAKKKAPAKKAETEAAPEGAPEAVPAKSVTAFEVEQSLTERLGRRVTVVSGKKSGTLVIEFYGEDDLKELSHRLAGE